MLDIPARLSDRMSVLESAASSETMEDNFRATHSAGKNYIEAENSDKTQRALRH